MAAESLTSALCGTDSPTWLRVTQASGGGGGSVAVKERGGSVSVGTLSTFEEEARGSGGTWVGAKVCAGEG